MKKILIFVFVVFSSCNAFKSTDTVNLITLTGKVEKLGLTTFRYGTHSIRFQGQVYSLKSSTINLDNYLDRQVTLKGTKDTSNPTEGRPVLIEVVDIKGQ